jgi:hypothetical protein
MAYTRHSRPVCRLCLHAAQDQVCANMYTVVPAQHQLNENEDSLVHALALDYI